MSWGPEGVVKRLGDYSGSIDYVLFDAATRETLDTDNLRRFLTAAYEADSLSNVGFGIAVGLNAELVSRMLPETVKEFPDVSWDAESQLHPMLNGQIDQRPIDIDSADSYLKASVDVAKIAP